MNNLPNATILVVDDEVNLEPLIRQKFRKQIREGIYHFEFALNGVEALKKIEAIPEIGLVLSDINMPEMDGLTLLSCLKERQKPGLKTVIVSAYGDMDNIRVAMNRGAYDFITKPINFEDLEITIDKTLDEVQFIRRSMSEHDQLISIQQDLNTARNIQQAILPKQFPPFPEISSFDIYASMVAANEVGGDFFDFFLIDAHRLGFVVADVSGKGVPAAIYMAISRTLIRAVGVNGVSAVECMERVNNLLCKESISSMFITVFYGIMNIADGTLEYVNAGHNPPYLITSSGVKELEKTAGLALGVMEDFSYTSNTIRLQPGEKVFLFTDGVNESFNAGGEMFGDSNLVGFLSQHGGSWIQDIVRGTFDKVHDFSDGYPQSDDITVMAIAYNG